MILKIIYNKIDKQERFYKMKKITKYIILSLMMTILSGMLPCFAISSGSTVRIEDIAHVKGVRENQVIGYGVVVGLPGTGDNSRSTQITNKMLLLNLGTVVDQANYIQKGSSAAVLVTATIPPFAKNGDKIDVTVSAMADAKSLEGGVLVQTMLRAPNGETIATAQGPLSVGGTSAEATGASKRTAITTTGRIPSGGIIERDINTQIGDEDSITIAMNKMDYTMVSRIASKIQSTIAPAKAIDGSNVKIIIPSRYQNDRVMFLSVIENLMVDVSKERAKVVVNERTGTVVIGNEVKLLSAAVAHGGITVEVTTNTEVSQPQPFAGGSTVGFQNSTIDIEKTPGSIVTVPANSTLNDLVKALNAIGVTPVDLISILQALREAGSLQADIQII